MIFKVVDVDDDATAVVVDVVPTDAEFEPANADDDDGGAPIVRVDGGGVSAGDGSDDDEVDTFSTDDDDDSGNIDTPPCYVRIDLL